AQRASRTWPPSWPHDQSPPAFWCRFTDHRTGTKLLCRISAEFFSELLSAISLVGVVFFCARAPKHFCFRQRDAVPFERETMTFAEIGLHEALLKSLTESGYTEPTAVQAQAIPA